jgi:NitT/TauT family transport system substrate-binding protein
MVQAVSRRGVRLGVLLTLVSVATLLFPSGGGAQERPKVVLLQGFPAMSFAPIYVARGKGFFEAEGLDMDVQIVRGASVAFQGVVAGQAQFAAMGATEIITAAGKGLKSVVAVAAVNRAVTVSIAVRKDVAAARGLSRAMPLKDRLAGLKGLRIGSASPGGAIHTVLMYVLKQAGLDHTRDVTVVAMGGQAEMVAALKAKHIDAFAVSPPGPETAEAGFAVLLLSLSRGDMPELGNIAYDALVTPRDYAEKNPEIVKKVIAAIGRASNFIPERPAEIQQVMLRFFEKTSPEVMKVVVENIKDAFAPDARFTEEMWKNAIRFNLEAGKIAQPLDSKEGVLWTNTYNPGR